MTDNNKKLALFDFDGTITDKDSFMGFITYVAGTLRFYIGFLIMGPFMAAFLAGFYPAQKMKERAITHFFMNRTEEELNALARRFTDDKINGLVKQSARDRIAWHKEENHDIAIVSASCSLWLEPWCRDNGLLLISSKMEIKDKKITGKLSGPNCKGAEKVKRIKEKFNLDDYSYIYAYGDSSGDTQMLELADESFYKHFK